MNFKLLEKWIEDWKNARIEYLDKICDAVGTWSKAHAAAFNNHSVREEIEVADYSSTKGRYMKTVKAVPVVINSKKYLEYRESGEKQYFSDLGLHNISKMDYQLARYCDRDERIKRITRDADDKRKSIIAKVEKICTDNVTEVAECPGDGMFIRGANGKVAHMWAIFAGGYNIQCLHIRILVKEARWLNQ